MHRRVPGRTEIRYPATATSRSASTRVEIAARVLLRVQQQPRLSDELQRLVAGLRAASRQAVAAARLLTRSVPGPCAETSGLPAAQAQLQANACEV